MLVATATSSAPLVTTEHPDYPALVAAFQSIFEQLARAIVVDGEGATKLINIQVQAGKTEQECQEIAYTIAHSPLVKTAFFAGDPNWGRILAAIGRADVAELDIMTLEVYLGDVCLVRGGGRADVYTEARAQAVMAQDEITIRVDLHRGQAETQLWTCDLSYDYVRINAEYRS
jgi:glutamate N-acetyltransferase/amino-acid N-acetyltransferase